MGLELHAFSFPNYSYKSRTLYEFGRWTWPQKLMGEIVSSSTCMDDSDCICVGPAAISSLELVAEQLGSCKPINHARPYPSSGEELKELGDKSCMDAADGASRERRPAVLICLFEGDQGEHRAILTKRSYNLSTHPGEVALPGGKMEEGDPDETATALREAMEEIGLDPALVQAVALLEPFISKHLLKVTPVVGTLADRTAFEPLLNPAEVTAVFDAPLEIFLKEENHRTEEKEWMGYKYFVHLFDFECDQGQFLIWGLTAGILIRAASFIYQRPPPYKEPSPDFQQLQRSLMNKSIPFHD